MSSPLLCCESDNKVKICFELSLPGCAHRKRPVGPFVQWPFSSQIYTYLKKNYNDEFTCTSYSYSYNQSCYSTRSHYYSHCCNYQFCLDVFLRLILLLFCFSCYYSCYYSCCCCCSSSSAACYPPVKSILGQKAHKKPQYFTTPALVITPLVVSYDVMVSTWTQNQLCD